MRPRKTERDQAKINILNELSHYTTGDATLGIYGITKETQQSLFNTVENYSELININPTIFAAVIAFCQQFSVNQDSNLPQIIQSYIFPEINNINGVNVASDKLMTYYFMKMIPGFKESKLTTGKKVYNIEKFRKEFIRYLICYLSYLSEKIESDNDQKSQLILLKLFDLIQRSIDMDEKNIHEKLDLFYKSIGKSLNILSFYDENNDENLFAIIIIISIFYIDDDVDELLILYNLTINDIEKSKKQIPLIKLLYKNYLTVEDKIMNDKKIIDTDSILDIYYKLVQAYYMYPTNTLLLQLITNFNSSLVLYIKENLSIFMQYNIPSEQLSTDQLNNLSLLFTAFPIDKIVTIPEYHNLIKILIELM